MASLLVAVGGTGQHMALAACRLIRLGALPSLRIAVIDADIHGELTQTLQTFGDTVQAPYTEHPAEGGIGLYPPYDPQQHADPAFCDLFASPSPLEKQIFETLFEESSAQVRVKEGFFGRPAVGVTVAVKYQESQLRPIWEAARLVAGKDNIFVTGSLTGGTGAGLVHNVVRGLREASTARIYGILYLRWFRMPSGAGARTTISDDTLNRNMRYGLDYLFRSTARNFHATLLLGLPDNPPHERLGPVEVHPGKTGELAHALHAVGAYGILKLVDIARTEQTGGAIYGAALGDPVRLYEERWWDGRPLAWYYSRAVWLRDILRYTCQPKFREELLSTFKRFLGAAPRNVGEGLHKAVGRYPESQRDTVIREMQKTWELLTRQYDFCLHWLDSVLGALPERLLAARSKKVDPVGEIQNLWRTSPIPEQEAPPPPPETARRFHDQLVQAFPDLP